MGTMVSKEEVPDWVEEYLKDEVHSEPSQGVQEPGCLFLIGTSKSGLVCEWFDNHGFEGKHIKLTP